MAEESPTRITRVVLKNYKSIVQCDVELKPLTILVGPNGSGKSNFVDALRFVQEALTVGLEQAIRNRGNASRILSEGRPTGSSSFSIALYLDLESGHSGQYSFAIKTTGEGGYLIEREELDLVGANVFSVTEEKELTLSFQVPGAEANETRRHTLGAMPSWPRSRLLLASYLDRPEALRVHTLLTSMVFYDPNPSSMRPLKPRDVSAQLAPDGSNIGSMVRRIQAADPDLLWRITQYLGRVLPGLVAVVSEDLAGRDLLRFSMRADDDGGLCTFDADQMSDGALRALGVLVALFQHRIGERSVTSLVGIEEPENNLHPAAGDALLNALRDASYDSQVLVTTHSTSLLDADDIDAGSLLAVVAEDGRTTIGPIDPVSRSILHDHLYTAGELLQKDQIRPAQSTEGNSQPVPSNEPAPTGR